MAKRKMLAGLTAIALMATGVAACGGSSVSNTGLGSTTGKITLTVQSGDGGETGLLAAYAKLDKEFEQQHPNVTVDFVTKNFTDLVNTLKLQLSGPNAPDVTQVNQGYSSMGQLVGAGLLRNLDSFASKYGWASRQSADELAINGRMTSDGKRFGSGNLYGMAATGAWVGVWENKKILASLGLTQPKTFAQFEQDLAVAKQHNVIPIQYGASDGGESIWLFENILLAETSADTVSKLIEAAPGSSYDSPAVIKAAATLQQWAKDGYFTPGYAAYNNSDVFAKFATGQGLFDINGSFNTGIAKEPVASELTMIPMPGGSASTKPAAIATGDIAWSIPTSAKNAAVAAEYINFITSPAADKVLISEGQVPASSSASNLTEAKAQKITGSAYDAIAGWNEVLNEGEALPYMDWSTPTFYNTLSAAVTELAGGKLTPSAFASQIQADYGAYTKK